MNKIVKKLMALFLVAVMLVGCGKTDNTNTEVSDSKKGGTEKSNNGKGRYLEDEFDLPEDIIHVFDLKEVADGKIQMLAYLEDGLYFYDSEDGGKSFKKKNKVGDVNENTFISGVTTNLNGEIFLIKAEVDNIVYEYIDKEGNVKNVDIKLPEVDSAGMLGGEAMIDPNLDNSQNEPQEEVEEGVEKQFISGATGNQLLNVKFMEDGLIAGMDVAQNIVVIDPSTGEVKKTFEFKGQFILDYYVMSNKLVVKTESKFEIYDLESGKPTNEVDVLNNFYAENAVNGNDNDNNQNDEVITVNNEKNIIYYINKNGVYSYTLGGELVEEVMNGALYALSDPSYDLTSALLKSDESFLMIYEDINENKKILKNYVFSAEVDSTPSNEINAYTLYDNSGVRNTISQYQKENPDTLINLEIGVNDKDSVEPADAIRILNTKILAGEGPDLLFLDGMPIESYIEKGLLASIDDIVKEVDKKDGLNKNIISCYQKDKENFAIPTRFHVPTIIAPSKYIDEIKDFDTFAKVCEKMSQENKDGGKLMTAENEEDLLSTFYNAFSANILKDKKTLDTDSIQKFYEIVKRISDVNGNPNEESMGVLTLGPLMGKNGISDEAFKLLTKGCKIAFRDMLYVNDMEVFDSIMKQLDYGNKIILENENKTFVQSGIVGINAKTSNLDICKKIVKSMLSIEAQSAKSLGGLPVNKAALEKIITTPVKGDASSVMIGDAFGNNIEIEYKWPSKEVLDKFRKDVEQLDTPVLSDKNIENVIIQEGVSVLKGEKSAKEATDEVSKKLNIYLAE